MRTKKIYPGHECEVTRFAWMPVTAMNRDAFETETVWLEKYSARIRYEKK